MSKNSAKSIPLRNKPATEVKVSLGDFPPSRKTYIQPATFQAPPPTVMSDVPKPMAIEITASKQKVVAKLTSTIRPDGSINYVRVPNTGKAFSTEGLTEEQINQHMVTLPPAAALSDVTKMSAETLNGLMATESKTYNQVSVEMQRLFAIMLFKKQFIIGDQICTIAELEFYPEYDPYRPNDEAFATSAAFYFRLNPHHYDKASNPATFLYVTAGAPGNRCGILIRSIITPNGFVEGPDKVVHFINKVSSGDSPKLALTDPPVDGNSNRRYDDSMIVYNGPRVGLTLREETVMYGPYCMFVMKPYRYTFCPGELKIAKHTLAANARLEGVPDMIINRDFKLPAEMLGRWITLFGRGESAHLEMFLEGKSKRLEDPSQQLLAQGFLSRFNK